MKKAAHNESNSLKTFYLYLFIVLVLILISSLIKGFFIFQQSKYNPSHDFTIAVVVQKNVKEVIAFHPQIPSIAILTIQNTVPYTSLAKSYGISTDAYIQSNTNDIPSDVATFMWSSLLHTADWQTNLTAYDKIRLLLFSRDVTVNNKTNNTITLSKESTASDTTVTNALTDQDISDENISIQIINATDITGFGQRLGRVLTNMGANVVDISTAQNTQQKSTIQYFGNETYTVKVLEKLLGIKATKLTRQTIADIIVTLGKDKRNAVQF